MQMKTHDFLLPETIQLKIGLTTDGHGWTRIKTKSVRQKSHVQKHAVMAAAKIDLSQFPIRVYPCPSVVVTESFRGKLFCVLHEFQRS
jgi:hypothetical protein